MRYLLLWLIVSANLVQAAVNFDGQETIIAHNQWRALDSKALPSWKLLAENIDQFDWVPPGTEKHRSPQDISLLRLSIHATYTGDEHPLLVIPYAFIPGITVGLVGNGKLLLWQTMDADMKVSSNRIHRSFGMLPLPISSPGNYELLVLGSSVANNIIVRGARLYLEQKFLLRDYPLDIGVASAFVGGISTYLLFCVALLIYRFNLSFVYALIFLTGSLGVLLLHEGLLFLPFVLDVSWWVLRVLPLSMGMCYAGALLYVHSELVDTKWRRLRSVIGVCGWGTMCMAVIYMVFPPREYMFLGALGLLVSTSGFVTAFFVIVANAWSGERRKIIFLICFGSFFSVVLVRTAVAVLGHTTSISTLPWYLTILLVCSYIFVDYVLSLASERLESVSRKTADVTRFDLVSRFSHELRTPLNAVIGLADLIKESKDFNKVKGFADLIHSAGYTLLELVNDILDFSKFGTSKSELARNPLRLDRVITDIVSGFLPYILEHKLHISFQLDPKLNYFLLGDEIRIKQIFSNLLSNAFKFSSSENLIQISIRQGAREEGRTELLCSVADQGLGIPSDKLTTIFEPFGQANVQDSTRRGGTGLGLAICKLLVEQMGGAINVISEEKRGSKFSFNLWLDCDPAAPDLRSCFAPLRGKSAVLLTARDNFGRPLAQYLGYWGVHVTFSTQFEEVTAAPYDLVIIDSGCNCTEADLQGLNALPESTAIFVIDVGPGEWLEGLHHPRVKIQGVPTPILTVIAAMTELISGERVDLGDITRDANTLGNHPHRVLLVDDNAVNLTVASKLLSALDVECETAANGKQALEMLRSGGEYTLLLLDCEMPEMDGFEVCRRWRDYERQHKSGHLPIVALTAHALDEVRDECLQVGMDDVLYKPIGRTALVALLNSYAKE